MGKASIVYVVGLSMMLAYSLLNINAASTASVDAYTEYYGRTMAHNIAATGANIRASSSASLSPSGNGHFSPAASARFRYSRTVLWEIWQLRPMARFDKPHAHFKRSASLIFRMDNLSCDIPTSWNFSRCRLPHFEKIIQRYFTP
jgi:hypothetical protein